MYQIERTSGLWVLDGSMTEEFNPQHDNHAAARLYFAGRWNERMFRRHLALEKVLAEAVSRDILNPADLIVCDRCGEGCRVAVAPTPDVVVCRDCLAAFF